MSWKSWLPIGVLTFVIGLLVFFPARVATTWFEAWSEGIRISGVRGTLLDGSARRLVAGQTTVEGLTWNVQLTSLLTGRFAAAVHVTTDRGGISGTAAYTFWGTPRLSDVHGSATLGWVAERAGYTFLPVTGDLTLRIEELALNDQLLPAAIDGRFRLANVHWQLVQPSLKLGSYSARLGQSESQLEMTVTDSSGPLAIKGNAAFSPQSRRYSLNARLRTRAGADQRLKNLLGMLGRPDNAGWYHIRQQGRL